MPFTDTDRSIYMGLLWAETGALEENLVITSGVSILEFESGLQWWEVSVNRWASWTPSKRVDFDYLLWISWNHDIMKCRRTRPCRRVKRWQDIGETWNKPNNVKQRHFKQETVKGFRSGPIVFHMSCALFLRPFVVSPCHFERKPYQYVSIFLISILTGRQSETFCQEFFFISGCRFICRSFILLHRQSSYLATVLCDLISPQY